MQVAGFQAAMQAQKNQKAAKKPAHKAAPAFMGAPKPPMAKAAAAPMKAAMQPMAHAADHFKPASKAPAPAGHPPAAKPKH